jgi:rubrerythrin
VPTRRTALVSGASALLAAGCGTPPVRTLAGNPRDVRVLAAALEVERTQIAYYEVGLRLAHGPAASVIRTVLAAERAHAAAVEELIRELGGTPAAPRPAADYGRGIPRSADAWFQKAIGLEEQWSAGYAALIPKLANKRLRGTFGALATTEAEHAVALDLRP